MRKNIRVGKRIIIKKNVRRIAHIRTGCVFVSDRSHSQYFNNAGYTRKQNNDKKLSTANEKNVFLIKENRVKIFIAL